MTGQISLAVPVAVVAVPVAVVVVEYQTVCLSCVDVGDAVTAVAVYEAAHAKMEHDALNQKG